MIGFVVYHRGVYGSRQDTRHPALPLMQSPFCRCSMKRGTTVVDVCRAAVSMSLFWHGAPEALGKIFLSPDAHKMRLLYGTSCICVLKTVIPRTYYCGGDARGFFSSLNPEIA